MTGTLGEEIAIACRRWEGEQALWDGESTVTYGEFLRGADRLIRSYRELGIAPGDRILCQLPNGLLHLTVAVATWRYGGVHVVADGDLTTAEVAQRVREIEAAVVVIQETDDQEAACSKARALHTQFPGLLILNDVQSAGVAIGSLPPLPAAIVDRYSPVARKPPSAEDPALILFTSGSTGKSKGVVRYHEQLVDQWQSAGAVMEVGPGDVHLVQLPLSHGFGLGMAIMGLMSGGKLVVMKRFSTELALRTITEQKPTILHGTPAHFRLLTDHLDPNHHDVSSLRIGQGSAGKFSTDLLRRVLDDLGMDLMLLYGCSEGLSCYTTNRDDILRGSVGRPLAGRVRILVDGRPAAPDEVGEIAFRRVHKFRYWGEAEADSEWHITGDLGRFDAEGRLFVLGRARYRINRGGLKITPEEVETHLSRYPGLLDCAITAVPDRVVGERVCACVVPMEGIVPTLTEIREYLGTSLARHKLPEELCVLKSIPRVQLDKVDRPELSRLASTAARERPDRRPW